MSVKVRVCKTCGSVIDNAAKVCPKCGTKKPFYKRTGLMALIIVVAFIWLSVITAIVSEEPVAQGSSENDVNVSSCVEVVDTVKEEPEIEYMEVTVEEMFDILDSNAMKAEQQFTQAYVEVTGELRTIDSDGKYICIVDPNESFTFDDVQCYLKDQSVKNEVLEMCTGDIITVRMKITDVGEVLGYRGDVIEFVHK